MDVVPDRALNARELGIPQFRGVSMRDTLPKQPPNQNTSSQSGSHWVCYYRNKGNRIYFDSFGQITPVEIQRYLKIVTEFARGREVIQRNIDIEQAANTRV